MEWRLSAVLLVEENNIAKLPDHVTYAEASVLPLAISTAMSALFQTDSLALQFPRVNPKPTGAVVLIWGGSSSVGACGIQLAKGAGYTVATTSNSHNLEYCKSIGADYAFDYTKEDVVEEIVATLQGVEFAGAFCAIIEPEVILQCAEIASKLRGKKFVATVRVPRMPAVEGLPDGVGTSFADAPAFLHNEVGPAVWGKWIPAALADGSLKCAPTPLVFGTGLEAIQGAHDRWKEGVSCQKVVVEIQ